MDDFPSGNRKNVKTPNKEPAQPLSKRQELNNHIVCMRNAVRQGRVQIINRLISQIQRYKNRKGETKEQKKAKRKADRILEEIQILKKIKKDKVSLYALQAVQALDVVLNSVESTSEERVLARLAHHPVILKEVKKYRDANPNWDKQIPVLLHMTREKRRKKKDSGSEDAGTPNQSKAPQGKPEIASEESEEEEESVEESRDEIFVKEEIDDNESGSDVSDGSSNEEEAASGEENVTDEEEDSSEETTRTLKFNQLKKSTEYGTNGQNLKPLKKSVSSNKKPVVTQAPLQNKSEGTVKVKFLTNLNELEEEEDGKNLVDITKPQKPQRPKSAFFVGGVDEPEPEEYHQPSRKPLQNQSRQNGSQSNPVFRKGKLISKPPPKQGRFSDKRQAQQPPFREGPGNKRFGGNSESLGAKKGKFSADSQNISFKPANNIEQQPAEKLHPSWEAKKKQQISLTEFKGKKIVFDDDDD